MSSENQKGHYVKVDTEGRVESHLDDGTDINRNRDKEVEADLDFNEEDEKLKKCMRFANPLVLVLALSIMFTTVFCIIFYGTLNSRHLINPEVYITEAPELEITPFTTGVADDAIHEVECLPACDEIPNSFCSEDERSCLCMLGYEPLYSSNDPGNKRQLIECMKTYKL